MTQDDLCRRNPNLNKIGLTANETLYASTTTDYTNKAICNECKRHSCVIADIKADIEKELKISDELEVIGESAAYRKSLEIINKHISGKEKNE